MPDSRVRSPLRVAAAVAVALAAGLHTGSAVADTDRPLPSRRTQPLAAPGGAPARAVFAVG